MAGLVSTLLTRMAGGSAPEFFTSLLGVLLLESEVGFGTIVGSAVFNVLFVIGICAYFSGFDSLPLTWFPLFRDSSFYLLSLGVLCACIMDEEVAWCGRPMLRAYQLKSPCCHINPLPPLPRRRPNHLHRQILSRYVLVLHLPPTGMTPSSSACSTYSTSF